MKEMRPLPFFIKLFAPGVISLLGLVILIFAKQETPPILFWPVCIAFPMIAAFYFPKQTWKHQYRWGIIIPLFMYWLSPWYVYNFFPPVSREITNAFLLILTILPLVLYVLRINHRKASPTIGSGKITKIKHYSAIVGLASMVLGMLDIIFDRDHHYDSTNPFFELSIVVSFFAFLVCGLAYYWESFLYYKDQSSGLEEKIDEIGREDDIG